MLAGGSCLDLVPLFGVSASYLYVLFDDFFQWILSSFQFPLVQWLRNRNWEPLQQLANMNADKTSGEFYGVFGLLDGLAVRIQCPHLSEVSDPGNYYCRKGFYALNVQAICDKHKRFLWCYPSNKGSTHDSAAFAGSRLHDLLVEVATSLKNLVFLLLETPPMFCLLFFWFHLMLIQ
jgi:DDE superfamily endonuclease